MQFFLPDSSFGVSWSTHSSPPKRCRHFEHIPPLRELNLLQMSLKSVSLASLLTCLIFLPFAWHNYSAYLVFCSRLEHRPEWCGKALPLVYSYVQSKYWDVGFLRYWTFQQLPNFIIAAPPLMLLFTFGTHYLSHFLSKEKEISSFLVPTLLPHVLHALVLCTILLFASHTQIILRLAASMPLTYWAAAWLIMEHPKYGRWWVRWSMVWGTISVVLWSTFLPPA